MMRLLGSGRVGDVWLAHQRTRGGLSRLVAVKLLRDQWADDSDVVKRMKDEGQVLALLQHQCIVGFHEITRIDGRLALVTEYVEGVSLSDYCQKGNLVPPRVAVDIIARVASALDWALVTPNPRTGRPLGLIHRDVKPPNIHLADQGEVKLMDFGLARSNEMERHAKTRMGDVLGTSGFASPEALAFQVMSAPGDVFALGCTLFELLVGEPFYGDLQVHEQARLALQSRDYQAFLASRLPLVQNDDLRILLEEMLAYSPESRPSAGTVCDACEDQLRQMTGPTFTEWNRARVAEMAAAAARAEAAAAPPAAPSRGAATPVAEGPSRVLIAAVLAASLGVFLCGASSLVIVLLWVVQQS